MMMKAMTMMICESTAVLQVTGQMLDEFSNKYISIISTHTEAESKHCQPLCKSSISIAPTLVRTMRQEQCTSPPPPLKEEQLRDASEYARSALKLFDEISIIGHEDNTGGGNDNKVIKQMTTRALGLVASCYARAGSAVTAEGLLQSTLDVYNQRSKKHDTNQPHCPMFQIDSRSAFLYYSSICSNWEKRESDAKKNEKIALEINDEILSENWRDISAIYSGLWLFTPSDF